MKHAEPFTKLVHQGLILGMAFRWYAVVDADGGVLRALDGDTDGLEEHPEGGHVLPSGERVQERYLTEAQIATKDGRPVHPEHGVRLVPVAEKMSKSRGNVVNPDDVVRDFGADSLRVYEMFMGPLEQVKPWQTSGIQGVRRFLDRADALSQRPLVDGEGELETRKLVHRTVKKLTEDIEALRFNTAISAMMILANHLNSLEQVPKIAMEKLVLCLSPFAPT